MNNEILAKSLNIKDLFSNRKFFIDYFQREYSWKEENIKILIDDLINNFLRSYNELDQLQDIEKYNNYYLGPIVLSDDNGKHSIVDGQQRMTSITLILIYLKHLQENILNNELIGQIEPLIFSNYLGQKGFNLSNDDRNKILEKLYKTNDFNINNITNETIINIYNRYTDIKEYFPDSFLKDKQKLEFFFWWLITKVILVEIKASSDEYAYMIFETMNDRGLNLTPTEMLKGYVLSKITDKDKRQEIDELWKNKIFELHRYGKNTDITFFQAWFRGVYAKTMRAGQAGSKDEDFELIGPRFHNWFKDKEKEYFNLHHADDFYYFFKNNFTFYVDNYLKILKTKKEWNPSIEYLNYISYYGLADSLQDGLLMSVLDIDDDKEIQNTKLNLISFYIENFVVLRSINYKKFGQATIKSKIFILMKKIRKNTIQELMNSIKEEIDEIKKEYNFNNIKKGFHLHGQNKKFIKYILSRIVSSLDKEIGYQKDFLQYYRGQNSKLYEIEHIIGNDYKKFGSDFKDKEEFEEMRNYIGNLILLQNGTNQSIGKKAFKEKVQIYSRDNSFAQTLSNIFYKNNPNFCKSKIYSDIDEFKAYDNFSKKEILERQELVYKILLYIYSLDNNFLD